MPDFPDIGANRKLFPLHAAVLDCQAQATECAKKIIPLNRRHFALDFGPEQSMHGGHGTPSLTGSLLSPPAPLGLRGVAVVAARSCADTIARSLAMSKRNRMRPRKV